MELRVAGRVLGMDCVSPPYSHYLVQKQRNDFATGYDGLDFHSFPLDHVCLGLCALLPLQQLLLTLLGFLGFHLLNFWIHCFGSHSLRAVHGSFQEHEQEEIHKIAP